MNLSSHAALKYFGNHPQNFWPLDFFPWRKLTASQDIYRFIVADVAA